VNHWGKIIGGFGGYLVGGPIGLLIGLLLGVLTDKYAKTTKPPSFTQVSPQALVRIRKEFFITTFSVLGYLFRCSGKPEKNGYGYAGYVLGKLSLPEERWHESIRLYNEGKMPDFSLHNNVGAFYVACRDQPNLLEMFIEILLYGAQSDGDISIVERNIILNICYQLDFNNADYERMVEVIKAEYRHARMRESKIFNKGAKKEIFGDAGAIHDAYAILDTTPEASDEEIKRAYRRLTSQHHPDKLISKGLPEELLKVAEIKTREIRAAYEQIRETRGI